MVRYPGRAAFVALIIWFVVAVNRYMVAPSAIESFGAYGGIAATWLVTALISFAGAFFYLLQRSPNPPLAAARFGIYAVVIKGLFDLGLASALEGQIGPTSRELMIAPEYWLEMVILILAAYGAGQFFVIARKG